MRTLIVLGLALAAIVFWVIHRDHVRDHRLSVIASEIAERPVRVNCPNFFQSLIDIRVEGGSVRFDASGRPSDTTGLETSVCKALSSFAKTRKKASFACVFGSTFCERDVETAVYSLLTLSHESQHLRGTLNESVTQCYALQTVALVAERLGSPPDEARAIARHFLLVDQPRMPPDYALPPECADRGRFDLHPDSSEWPSG